MTTTTPAEPDGTPDEGHEQVTYKPQPRPPIAPVIRLPGAASAEVVQPPAFVPAPRPESDPELVLDTHFEITLDDQDGEQVSASRKPVYVDVVSRDHDKAPIIPAAWRPSNVGGTLRLYAGNALYRTGFHLIRLLPLYVPVFTFWAIVGVFKLIGRQIGWWWVAQASGLMQAAASSNDPVKGAETWSKLHRETKSTRLWRFLVLCAEAIAITVAVVMLARAPWWAWVVVAAVLIVPLAQAGRPTGKRLVPAAVVAPRFRKLNADIVLRAYYAAGLGHPDKPNQQIAFGSVMARDRHGQGSEVLIDLPYGKGFGDAINARERLASGLDVAVSQVMLTRDPSSHRRHKLWVADRDPLALGAGRTPLLRCQQTDIWQDAPFGLDERGEPVNIPLLWHSYLFGAMPRQGKTFSARLPALYAALDPYVRLFVFDPSAKPDWRKFALVADAYSFGITPTRDGDPVEIFVATLEAIKADVEDRYNRLSQLPVSLCPEGKLTREIARDPRFNMPVTMIVMDEFQEYFELGGDIAKQIGALLIYLVKVAPGAGVIFIDATQKPSGVGAGQVETYFKGFRDNHLVRFALRTGAYQVSDAVLGAGAYSEGHDSSALLPSYKGVGILRGASDATPIVRTYLADIEDAEKILIAARKIRERAGTLSGMAAGQPFNLTRRDPLADVRDVFYAGEAFLAWEQIASRLASRFPEAYAEINKEAVSAQIRALGVRSIDGKVKGTTLKGARLEHITDALRSREIEGGR